MHSPIFYLEHPRCQPIDEVAIVRDEQDGA